MKLNANQLIAKAKDRALLAPPTAKAVAELRKVLAHNDSVNTTGTGRVPAEAAIALLRAYGWKGTSRRSLNAICAQLGRHSYGTP